MKTVKKIIPALLGDSQQPSRWHLTAQSRTDSVEMTFTNRVMADAEYRRIKSAGTIGGQWLTAITLEEVKNDQPE